MLGVIAPRALVFLGFELNERDALSIVSDKVLE
jgi:hypothetical protein